MFDKNRPEKIEIFNSTIDSKVNIEGNVISETSVHMSGKLSGDIHCEDDVFIGPEGFVNGNIYAANIFIAGIVEGSVEAEGFLKILGTGKLYGNIVVRRLITDEGAVFEGNCSMTDISASSKGHNQPEVKKIRSESMFRKKNYIEESSSIHKIDDTSGEN
ncbi:MAG: polymer-forming cytoskeletal protein [Oscillospiraceae bacterium]|nr:polymer-forming cytoskeletal protein [Oscillospiraceae bacterium]